MAQIRLFDIRDVSLVQRLSPMGRPLAYETAAVHGLNPLREAMRGFVYAGYDNTVALIRRDPDARELDSFGLMSLIPERGGDEEDTKYASMLFAAPCPLNDNLTGAWAELAEAFVGYAADHGVQCIVAETPEASNEAEALRRVGFSALMHQDIMKLVALPEDSSDLDVIGLRPQEDKDEAYIKLLNMRIVPKLVQKAEGNTDLTRLNHRTDCGFILLRHQEPLAHISLQQGRRGYGMQLLFRPETEDVAEPMLRYALANLCGRGRRPVYCMVPTYQSWLLPILDNLGFTHITSNAIMVKHTTARVRQPVWTLQTSRANTKLINSETKLQARETHAQHKH
jgi:hypothetical protein